MVQVLACLTMQHDWRLVVLATTICFATSVAAFKLLHRARAASGARRALWLAAIGAAVGYGVWATHFIGMLAFDAGVPVEYDFPLTALSLLVAASVTGFGFAIAAERQDRWAAPVGGGTIGAGVAIMHYTGMWAMDVPGQMHWSTDLILASILLGIGFASAAMFVASPDSGGRQTFAAALLLTLAITSHHFTAMSAVVIIPDPTIPVVAVALSSSALAMTITVAAVAVLGISLVAALADSAQAHLRASSERELAEQSKQLQAALTNMPQGLCMFDGQQRILVTNARYREMYGLTLEQTRPGISFRQLLQNRVDHRMFPAGSAPDDYVAEVLACLARGSAWTQVTEVPDGRIIAVSNRTMPGGGWVATHEDITERRSIESRLAHMAHHDTLTGLPNRALLRERLETALAAIVGSDGELAVILLDLDRFKEVNDTLGHAAGDTLLKQVAERLRVCVREGDTIARLGGDEFAIVHRIKSADHETTALAVRIQETIAAPFILNHNQMAIGTSIGIAIAPQDGSDPDHLMDHADLALYLAKMEGRGRSRFFEPAMHRRMHERRDLEHDLRAALAKGQFNLHYQPLVNIARDEICCFEALLRWTHPERGNIPPARFIPLAEETGLIAPIGEWVLREACKAAASWPSSIKVAVNVSAAQFKSRDLVAIVVGCVASSGLSPQRLELEITETAMLQDEVGAFALLSRMHDLGVHIALDDFGTGYSSLSNLRKFPFDKIKIDQSFIRDLSPTNLDAIAVVRSIAQLGESLKMTTTAEGVETEEQLDYVRAQGCSEAQGFLFSPPVLADEVTPLLRSYRPVSMRVA
ncbi:MAG: EAL domain-containing protein [Hyphomicrobiaceae bacterium]|nr:EAL domain-containing protein [Hyphomicrobiaceae bacterium]